MVKPRPQPRCGKEDSSEVITGGFLVVRGYSPEVFKLMEEALHETALAIKLPEGQVG